MSLKTEKLRRKIKSADDLNGVVRTMKNWAAVSVGPYERAVIALNDYYQTIELGLAACVRHFGPRFLVHDSLKISGPTGVVAFGSDQGMIGQFNEQLAEDLAEVLRQIPGEKLVWPIGDRIAARLTENKTLTTYPARRVPDSVAGISPLVGQLLFELETMREHNKLGQVFLFHNHHDANGRNVPIHVRLFPLDAQWVKSITAVKWPTNLMPQVRQKPEETLAALVREYLFISLFKACAESLSSENECRLAAMQAAEDNIGKLKEQMQAEFNQARTSAIDDELFDVIAGFEATV